jgi:hypothetical protein
MKQTHYLTTTVQPGNRLELDLPTLIVGQSVEVILIVPDSAAPTSATVDRRALLKLPLADRRRMMAQQAEAALPYYEQDPEWQEWVNFDLVGTND